jgi:enoyl-CoA hydratase
LAPGNAVTVERDGHVLLIGLNRPEKRNAFNLALIDRLAAPYYELENDDAIRWGVLFGHGDHFTAGLDLAEVGPLVREGRLDAAFAGPGRRDPWRKDDVWSTPLVVAVHGWVMTLAIELLLAADIRIAASNARFAQLEIRRGIYAFGGATVRLPRDAGWGNAMRWLLTGEQYDAAEALRTGLVQEVVEPGRQLDPARAGGDGRREVRTTGRKGDAGVGPSRAHRGRSGSLGAGRFRHGQAIRDRGWSRGAALVRRATRGEVRRTMSRPAARHPAEAGQILSAGGPDAR